MKIKNNNGWRYLYN